ncbi:MAG TPA: tripartite tricarboxylate transporter substrate binding protein [Ramlibacter sp.]|jgi:tripartite-type tricarboxylate transporter receptor subunit TctC|nr:tripartite tricarboxylate transporter substrate binding protein [Ramlibacter sp.]
MNWTRRSILHCLGAATLVAGGSWVLPAAAQDAWPAKPVRFIVPFAPGGSTDVVARMVGQKLSMRWNQPVVIENRAGAGGNIGADLVAKSAADGYTLLFASGSIAINPHIYKHMSFDTDKDLVPITNVASGPMLVVVPDRSPIKSIKDLVAQAKAHPGSINFGSAGVGSQVHMAGESFANAAHVELTHVPYKGESVAYNDLIAGQIQMMVGNFAAASALLGPGRLRALAVTAKTRSPQLPDVPTAAESGLPGFENIGWFGLFAPAGTPKEVLARVQRDTAEVLGDTDIKARLYVQGMQPVGNSSADFAAALKEENRRWDKVVKERHLAAH